MAASFHEVRLPEDTSPGVQWGPAWATTVIVTGAGFEQRNQLHSRSRRVGRIALDLRTAAMAAELVEFFEGRAGRTYGFRYKDWADYSVVDEVIAHNEAVQVQLTKTYSSGGIDRVRNIYKPVAGSVTLEVNGSPYTTFALDTTSGTIWLAAALAANDVLTWSGEFDVPVRFDTDVMEMVQQAPDWRDWSGIPIVELREAPVPTLPVILDSFNRANENPLTVTDTGEVWVAGAGTLQVVGNVCTQAISPGVAYVESFRSDAVIELSIDDGTTPNMGAIVARWAAPNDYIWFSRINGQTELWTVVGGVFTTQLDTDPYVPQNGDRLQLTLLGTAVSGSINGTPRVSATTSFNQASTLHGVTSPGGGAFVDDFELTGA